MLHSNKKPVFLVQVNQLALDCSSVVTLAMPQVSSRPLQIYISGKHGGGNITTITLPN